MEQPVVRLLGAAHLQPPAGPAAALVVERRNQLLAYLACRGRWASRDELADLLWPDRSQAAARSNLRNVVMQIRRSGIEGFEVHADMLRWQIGTDVQDFENALSAGDWATALGVYGGPLLPGFEADAPPTFANWLGFERSRLLSRWQDALTARLGQLGDDMPAVAALAAHALRSDPLNETALAALIGAQSKLGRLAEARRAWRTYVETLANDHGIEPGAGLRALAAGLQSPPVNAEVRPGTAAGNVDCIGRRLEQRQVAQLLADPGCRLLAVTGTGGVGKSTLARAAASTLAAQFADGCTWIALEDLGHTDAVAPRIASQLGVPLAGIESPLEQVMQELSLRRCLLVLDNAEHLADFDRLVQSLLHRCPHIKLLVTSRTRLAVPGEWLLPLEGLPVPDRDEVDPEILLACDAVRLFEVRARALSPAFVLQGQAGDVVALVHAVDGLPLALELAAACTRLLPVREIVHELGRSLDLLQATASGAARDRSLRASFDHSWRLLAPVERDALARLAVLVGSFTRTAAEHVANAPLAVLVALLDKSLLRSGGDGRFSLHPLLRQYAGEHLSDGGATTRTHADFYAQLLARYGERDYAQAAMAEMELDLPNFTAAWETSIVLRLAGNVERMASPLGRFHDLRGRGAEGIALMQRAAMAFDAGFLAERRAYANAHAAMANLMLRHAGPDQTEVVARRGLRAFIAARDRRGIALSLNALGNCLWMRGAQDEARRCYARALRRLRCDGDEFHASKVEGNFAIVEKWLGNFDRALVLYGRSLARQREADDRPGQISSLNNVAELYRLLKRLPAALASLQEGLRLCEQTDIVTSKPVLILNLAGTCLELGDLERASTLARQAFELATEHGHRIVQSGAPLTLARVALARGSTAEAYEHLHEALVLARANRQDLWQVAALGVYAHWLAARDRRLDAATFWHMLQGDPRSQAADRIAAGAELAELALPEEQSRFARERARGLTLDAAVDAMLAEPVSAAHR